jgi:hypothetical protein
MASGSYVPHQQAEHMTAPTRSRTIFMKTLANGEPSTHDPTTEIGLHSGVKLNCPGLEWVVLAKPAL